ncbi:MAG: hypothetical protein ACI3YG_07575 [Prevotella sp.]
MDKLTDLIPQDSLNLVKYSGNELIGKLGKEIISNVEFAVMLS